MKHNMDSCPAELWGLIFTYAYTDNGFTGRSLSASSRYLRQVSKPYQYRPLAIDGKDDAPALANNIASGFWDPGLQPVYHFLVTWDDGDVNRNRGHIELPLYTIIKTNCASLRSLVLRAPHLYILSKGFTPQSITFPRLHRLCIFACSPDTFFVLSQLSLTSNSALLDANDDLPPKRKSVAFPSLKHARFRHHIGLGNATLYSSLAQTALSLRTLQINQTILRDAETLRANLTNALGFIWDERRGHDENAPGTTRLSTFQSGSGGSSITPTMTSAPRYPTVIVELMSKPRHPIQVLSWNDNMEKLRGMENERFRIVERGDVFHGYASVLEAWLNDYWS